MDKAAVGGRVLAAMVEAVFHSTSSRQSKSEVLSGGSALTEPMRFGGGTHVHAGSRAPSSKCPSKLWPEQARLCSHVLVGSATSWLLYILFLMYKFRVRGKCNFGVDLDGSARARNVFLRGA